MANTYRVLNLGAGVQSTTLYLMYLYGQLTPQIDVAIFADTGEEPKAVYEHLEWLKSLAGPKILVRSIGHKLGDDLINECASWGTPKVRKHYRHRFVSIPAFIAEQEKSPKGKTQRQCTKEYKVKVIERAIRRDVLGLAPGRTASKGTVVTQIAGISLDEAGRAYRMQQRPRPKYLRWEFPLIEHFMTRQDCLAWLAKHVPDRKVPRSACVFCPYHSDAEWQAIKEVPEDWERAVEIDEGIRKHGARAAQNLDENLYVHRSCQPLVQIDFSTAKVDPRKAQLNLNFNQDCMGMCGV